MSDLELGILNSLVIDYQCFITLICYFGYISSMYSDPYNNSFSMGNKPKGTPPPTMEEMIMEMRMTAKRFTRESGKAEKEEKQNIKKAKMALKKNNEEGAKMYLAAAATKHNQAMNMQRMAMKMDSLTTVIKSGNSNQVMMNAFNKITYLMNTTNQPDIVHLANNLQNFETTMDQMLINGKVMDEMLNKGSNTDSVADSMMEKLKLQMAMETEADLNNAAKLRMKEMQDQQFLKNMKGL